MRHSSPPFRLIPSLLLPVLVTVAAGLWPPSLAHAQGFGVYEQGTCAMARAGAAVADGCGDGSSIYFNPAHVADAEGVTASLGATVIDARGEFTYDHTARPPYTGVKVDLQNDPIPVPHGYLTYGLTERLGVGLGLYVPYGLETNWPVQFPDGSYFDGAFEGFKSRIQNIYVQPTVAYQITPKLRVGAGPIVAFSSVELRQLLDLSQQTTPAGPTFGKLGVPFHTAFARVGLEASNEIGYGANVGVSFRATDRLSVGVRFTTPITISYEGNAEFTQLQTGLIFPASSPLAQDLDGDGTPDSTPADLLLAGQFDSNGVLDQYSQLVGEDGALSSQTVETEITFPFQLVAGISVRATEKLKLLADYQLTGWSAFDQIPLEFEALGERVREQNYGSTHAVRLGAQYDVIEQLTARLGYLHNTAAAPDEGVTPLLPEAARNQFTVGVGWRPVEQAELNVSYQLLLQNDRRGRVRGPLPGQPLSTDLNQGVYSFGANLFGATLTLHL
ncbi:MAG: long-chain fatty acid transporter [Bacteroidetes bacterium QH_10_64_37]|nr:MAG: long-chain fatty acid transporter [Bacteroidetes bacterium QH_10_64_37]